MMCFAFKGELHNLRQFEKARAVAFLWHDIVKASQSPAGPHFQIMARSNSFILHKCAEAPGDIDGGSEQALPSAISS